MFGVLGCKAGFVLCVRGGRRAGLQLAQLALVRVLQRRQLLLVVVHRGLVRADLLLQVRDPSLVGCQLVVAIAVLGGELLRHLLLRRGMRVLERCNRHQMSGDGGLMFLNRLGELVDQILLLRPVAIQIPCSGLLVSWRCTGRRRALRANRIHRCQCSVQFR